MRIYLITIIEEIRGNDVEIVSHGVDPDLNNICLPPEPLTSFVGRKFDTSEGLFYIEDQ